MDFFRAQEFVVIYSCWAEISNSSLSNHQQSKPGKLSPSPASRCRATLALALALAQASRTRVACRT
jgi:hypothetical protein